MTDPREPDWDPKSDAVLRDQGAAYDDMRRRCPVAHSEALGWSLFRHEDVSRVLLDHETFSNVVSERRSVPNGMDPPEHGAYREALEPYFTEARMRAFEPVCRSIARALLDRSVGRGELDFVEELATPFALRCQCAFLGWPDSLAETIREWTRKNNEAILSGDKRALEAIARELGSFVGQLLAAKRANAAARDDVTASLLRTRVNGALLTDEELTSVLRNWTVGEVGSLAAALAILARHVAADADLQDDLRKRPALIPAAVEEILRTKGPLVSNRRRATKDVTIGGRHIAAGQRVSVMWIAANRDERVFESPDRVRLDRDQSKNLLWGAGIHVCPGAPLARLELRVALEELLRGTRGIELGEAEPLRAVYPANGWLSLPLRLR